MKSMRTAQDKQSFFSSLAAVILLSFVFPAVISRNVAAFDFNLFGLSLSFTLKPGVLMIPVAAAIAAIGVYSAIEVDFESRRSRKLVHVIVPISTTVTLGILLGSVAIGSSWLVILFAGGLLLYSVFISESLLCFRSDPRSAPASVFVTALAYASAAIVFSVAKALTNRLIFFVLFLLLISVPVAWRIFLLEAEGIASLYKAVAVGLIVTEMGAALFYLPFVPLSFGAPLFTAFYSVVNLVIIVSSGFTVRAAVRRLSWPIGMFLASFVYIEFFR